SLGDVNGRRGYAQRGRARAGGLAVSYPQPPHDESRAATAFVRSHELDVLREPDGRPHVRAKVVHVNPAGPVVKIRLVAADFGISLNVNLDRERHAELALVEGDEVYVSPRKLRVFVSEFS